ncbi:thioredoxin-disulfide reductase [Clostridium sp. AN503]|uniref:thioredoxin-disulfide reductase n=1 Tax=Clostridium sp. AN503 TaxID=3160598 RepID=UPI003459C638
MAREAVREDFDLIIIGGGPGGLAAGIYGGRAKLKTLILEKGTVGGRAHTTREIVNYPGTPSISGPALSEEMKGHAMGFGVDIRTQAVKSVDFSGQDKIVKTKRGEYHAPAVILATGTSARILGIPGEKEYTGMGVGYCATCDAEFFQDQEVVVVGSGDQAIEEGMYITKFASRVTVVVLHDEGILDCNKQAAEKALAHPKMNFIWNSVLDEILGDGNEVTGVRIKNEKTGELSDFTCQGVFFFVGMVPETEFVKGQIELDNKGWIHTNEMMETSVEGVYAVGDVREKYLRQVATAVSDGAIAATAAERYIEEQQDFKHNVLESSIPVILAFWSPEVDQSLEAMTAARAEALKSGEACRFMEIDITRKKGLARTYGVVLDQEHPAVCVKIVDGTAVTQ